MDNKTTNDIVVESDAPQNSERGVALVITLLLVAMTTAMGLVMFLSVFSDMLINGYYRNFRSSFYAADSGLNIGRAQLMNQVISQIPSTFAAPPIANPTLVANTATTYLSTQYGTSTSLNAGQGANAWPESFKITGSTFSLASGYPIITSQDSNNNPTGYTYVYNYSLTSMGSSMGSEQASVSESGSLTFNITGATLTTNVSFAAFGAFVDQYPPCLGPLVPGTMTGPMFTNGAWEFMTGGTYIFTDPVGQANANANYWFNWNCYSAAGATDTVGGQTIAPTFQGGFNLGQPPVALPPNDFSQKRAVLNGTGLDGSGNPTTPYNSEMTSVLKTITGTAYPAYCSPSSTCSNPGQTIAPNPPPGTTGVYMPFTQSGGVNTASGGGIYVEGDASITLTPSGASAQVYAIAQGTTTTTVTIDPSATPPATWNCPGGTVGSTIMVQGGTTTNICGVPKNNLNNSAATMLYVDGNITGLTGPGEGQGAIQDGTQLTITAKGDITATGDVLYKTEPVTVTQNQVVPGTNPPCCSGSPVDTLIPGADKNQVLGIFTATGNFNLNNSQADGNIQVDGSIATISQGGTGGFFDTGGEIYNFNNVGGQIQNSIYGAAIDNENVYFDRRFTNKPGFAPPWFPSTTVTQGGAQSTNITSTVQRVQWINKTTVQ